MKKEYSKPKCEVERFELTSFITSCAVRVNLTDGDCVKNTPNVSIDLLNLVDMGVFMDGCIFPPDDMNALDGICVHTSVNLAFPS